MAGVTGSTTAGSRDGGGGRAVLLCFFGACSVTTGGGARPEMRDDDDDDGLSLDGFSDLSVVSSRARRGMDSMVIEQRCEVPMVL